MSPEVKYEKIRAKNPPPFSSIEKGYGNQREGKHMFWESTIGHGARQCRNFFHLFYSLRTSSHYLLYLCQSPVQLKPGKT